MTINYSTTVQFSEEDSKIVDDFFRLADELCIKIGDGCYYCPFRSSGDNRFCCLTSLENTMIKNGVLQIDSDDNQVSHYSLKDCTISQNK